MANSEVGSAMDVSKMKVPDLKRELKARGLSTTGNKNELIERLQAAVKSKLDDNVSAGSADDLEEDLLNDDDDEHLDTTESVIEDLDSELQVTTPTEKSQKRKSDELGDSDQDKGGSAKKIVLNRNASISSDTSVNGSQEDKAEPEKKVIKLSELSVKERLEMRAKKFGVQISADARKAARSERFGTESSLPKTSSNNNPANVDILQKRAERFGTSVSPALSQLENKEKLEKRKQRFGVTSSNGSSLDSDKAKMRLERFKEPVK